jgi:hypothetical protein
MPAFVVHKVEKAKAPKPPCDADPRRAWSKLSPVIAHSAPAKDTPLVGHFGAPNLFAYWSFYRNFRRKSQREVAFILIPSGSKKGRPQPRDRHSPPRPDQTTFISSPGKFPPPHDQPELHPPSHSSFGSVRRVSFPKGVHPLARWTCRQTQVSKIASSATS